MPSPKARMLRDALSRLSKPAGNSALLLRPVAYSTLGHQSYSTRLQTSATSQSVNEHVTGEKRTRQTWSRRTICQKRCLSTQAQGFGFSFTEETVRNTRDVWIALGSNVGDRFQAIEDACRAIDADPDMRILQTSPLYETKPMYVEDQGRFLNGACEIATTLQPTDLLDRLQAIENELGRVKLVDKGPRNIDLDILFFRNEKVDSERLKIPHPLIMERAFVLRPLAALGKDPSGVSAEAALASLPQEPMYPCVPLAPNVNISTGDYKHPRHVMAILNTTPDSFSDGGDNVVADANALRKKIAADVEAGATIIDIGGQSSRPNAEDVTAEEELSRVLPAIKAAKSLPQAANIVISVDTYRASVAEAAIKAGAHMINDISAGLLDPDMLPTIARLGCTYVMMHMRGTPHNMQSSENTKYPDGLIGTVANELQLQIAKAQAAGIRRWRIILDPGFGFAKTVEQNVELLAKFAQLRGPKYGLSQYPFLVGVSRKGFIGKVTGEERAKERVGGTAAAVALAALQGTEIHRAHDVGQMAQAMKLGVAARRALLGERPG